MSNANIKQIVKDTAFDLLESGLSVIPCDENKRPLIKWKENQFKPLSALAFEKAYAAPVIAIAPTPEDKIECLDFDKKNYPEGVDIYEQFSNQILMNRPQLWRKLYVEETQSGGFHVVYKVDELSLTTSPNAGDKRSQIRGVAYASRYEVKDLPTGKKKIQPLTMIETRVHGGYFIIAPSSMGPGKDYKKVKGDLAALQTITESERHYLLDVCEDFEDVKSKQTAEAEVAADVARTSETARQKTAPKAVPDSVKSFDIYNAEHNALEMLFEMGCAEVGRAGDVVRWIRPGDTESAHSGYYYGEINRIFVFSTSVGLPTERVLSPADIFCISNGIDPENDQAGALALLRANGYGKNPQQAAAEPVKAEDGVEFIKFWVPILDSKGTPKIVLRKDRLVEFLHSLGFRRYKVTEDSLPEFKYVKNNVVYSVDEDEIFRAVYNFTRKHKLTDEVQGVQIKTDKLLDYFIGFEANIKRSAKMLRNLKNSKFLKTTLKKAHIFYNNTAVEITKDGLENINYKDLSGYIWENQIIDKSINIDDNRGAFEQFVRNILAFQDNFDTMRSAIGYLLHRHHGAIKKAVIFTDRFSSEDEANGGTGKSLLARGLEQMVACANIPAKNWAPDQNFAFQSVGYEDHLLILNDIDKIAFDKLYNIVTDETPIEKKGKATFKKQMKVLITTNHLFKNDGESSERRKVEIEFGRHYNATNTPIADFGFPFFDAEEMPKVEWDRFFTFNMRCMQFHLLKLHEDREHGGLLPNLKVSKEHKEKAIIADVGLTLFEWLEDEYSRGRGFYNIEPLKIDSNDDRKWYYYNPKEIYELFKQSPDGKKYSYAQKTFTEKLRKYAKNKGNETETRTYKLPTISGEAKAIKALIIEIKKKENEINTKNEEDEDAPF